jgi:DNA-binding transcriptional MerR regulator
MGYTINQLARLAGVSVRTLHHYDSIGLLKPALRQANGYRQYDSAELTRLQQILFFRELDFPLADIQRMLNSPYFDPVTALEDQKLLIQLKRTRLNKLLKTINKTIMTMSNQTTQNQDDMYDVFKDEDVKQYQDEVKQKWGNTAAYKQSMERVKKMTKAEMDKLKADGKIFNQKLAVAMPKGISDPTVQALVAEHYKGINFFYDCSLEMYRNLGLMYVQDPRFTANYDKVAPGLAQFMHEAIDYYCNHSVISV